MPTEAAPTCPKCAAPVHLLAAVFESVVENVASILKNQPPLSRVFYCDDCKHVVWIDRKGKKSLKAIPPTKPKPKAKKKPRK